MSWAASCGGDGVGDDDGALDSGKAEVVTEREEGDVGAVGDEGEVEAVGEGECALDDVVVSVDEHGAAVAEVCEEGETGVDGGSELIEGGVGVSCGGADVIRDEALDEAGVGIGLWGEGEDACESVGGVQEAFE